MHDCKAVSFAILMTNAFGRPTTDGIDDFGWAFNGTEAVTQAVAEGVDDTSIRYERLHPLVQSVAGIVCLALRGGAVSRK